MLLIHIQVKLLEDLGALVFPGEQVGDPVLFLAAVALHFQMQVL